MVAVLERQDSEVSRLEERALVRMIGAICDHVECLAQHAGLCGRLDSREAGLQLEAFKERRAAAARALRAEQREPADIRIARLQKLVEALDCSRDYFRTVADSPGSRL